MNKINKGFNQTDHDLLTKVLVHVKYIRKNLQSHSSNIAWLKEENQERKDWQETWTTKTKVFIGIATFLGGGVVFLGNAIWDVYNHFKK